MSARHARQIRSATRSKDGRSGGAASNTYVHYTRPHVDLLGLSGPRRFSLPGERMLLGLDGPQHLVAGSMRFYHWNTLVLVIDFDKSEITDDGYVDYSMTTHRNVDEWADEVRDRYRLPIPYGWAQWTRNFRDRRFGGRIVRREQTKQKPDEPFDRFRAGVNWLRRDGRSEPTWWLNWKAYDEAQADAWHASRQFLREDNNWRYYTYAWHEYPFGVRRWEREFIDEDAKRRWRARERKNSRPCPPT